MDTVGEPVETNVVAGELDGEAVVTIVLAAVGVSTGAGGSTAYAACIAAIPSTRLPAGGVPPPPSQPSTRVRTPELTMWTGLRPVTLAVK